MLYTEQNLFHKTKSIEFLDKRAKPQNHKIIYNDERIDSITQINFLVLHIDQHCEWKTHTNSLCTEFSRFVYALQ